ncbi:MAG TPA: hypothetical protein VGC08_02985, partial [Pedobacter sp.]
MKIHADKKQGEKRSATANQSPEKQNNRVPAFQIADSRPETLVQMKIQEIVGNSPKVQQLKVFQDMANQYRSKTLPQIQYVKENTLQAKFSNDREVSPERKIAG